MRYLFGLLFCAAGVLHFIKTEFYLKIMPPYLPFHRELVYASGAAAFVLGALLMIPGSRRIAAWGMIAYLIAVYPANIYMALHPGIFPDLPAWIGWARLPLQFVLILMAYRFAI